jgi:pilus assembly protein CpaE
MAPLRTLLLGSDPQRDQLRSELADPRLASLVGEAKGLLDGLEKAAIAQPDLVVVAYGGDFAATLVGLEGLLAACPSVTLLLVGAKLESRELGEAMRAGVREVLEHAADLAPAVQRAQVFLSRVRGARSEPEAPRAGKVLVVYSPRGGSGKTTLAANLAMTLATELAGGAALVELSSQFAELDLLFNVKPPAHLSDVARLGPRPDAESIDQALCAYGQGLKIMGASPTAEDGELIDAKVVTAVLAHLRRRFDMTVVDTASWLTESTVRALEIADHVVVPMFPDLASLRHLQRALRLFADLGIGEDKVEIVTWAQKSEIDEAAIKRILHKGVAKRLPYVPDEAMAAINAGSPIVALSPNGSFARACKAYAQRFGPPVQTALVEVRSPAHRLAELWNRLRRIIDVPAQPT